jgi:hypothetical protein
MVGNVTIIGTASGNGKFNTADQGLTPGVGTLIGLADFSTSGLVPASISPNTHWESGAYSGGAISIVGGAFKAAIPLATGNVYTLLEFFFAPNTRDVYIEMRVKFSVGQWLKFIKFFGINLEGEEATYGYSNATYGVLESGELPYISFGDGANTNQYPLLNDVGQQVRLDSTYPQYVGRSYPSPAIVSTPQSASFSFDDGEFHTIKIHQKFNSGTTAENEVADGVSYLEIDGLVYSNTRNLFNRHYMNKSLDRVSFLGYAQNGTVPFDVFIELIKISTGGFVS